MSMAYPLNKNHRAEAPLTINRIVKPGVGAGTVVLAAAASDALWGVVNEVAATTGEPQDVVKHGPAVVEAGAAFGVNVPLTSDATGRAILATTAGQRVVGFSDEAATAAGDIVRILVSPGVF